MRNDVKVGDRVRFVRVSPNHSVPTGLTLGEVYEVSSITFGAVWLKGHKCCLLPSEVKVVNPYQRNLPDWF